MLLGGFTLFVKALEDVNDRVALGRRELNLEVSTICIVPVG